jgi:hypothetical protein
MVDISGFLELGNRLLDLAETAIEAYRDKMPEAKASINIKIPNRGQRDVLLTIRDNDAKKLWKQYLEFESMLNDKKPQGTKKAPIEKPETKVDSQPPRPSQSAPYSDNKPIFGKIDLSEPKGKFPVDVIRSEKQEDGSFQWTAYGGDEPINLVGMAVPDHVFFEAIGGDVIEELIAVTPTNGDEYSIDGLDAHYGENEHGYNQVIFFEKVK